MGKFLVVLCVVAAVLALADANPCFLKENFPGNDIAGKKKKQADMMKCVHYCKTVKGCKFVTYNTKDKMCWPKTAPGKKRVKDATVLSSSANCAIQMDKM